MFKTSEPMLDRPLSLMRLACASATAIRWTLSRVVRGRDDRSESGGVEPWTAARLRRVVRTHMSGQRLVVVSNREPLIHEWTGDRITSQSPASGLVTALEPVMRACAGVWVAHGSGTADRQAADSNDRVLVTADGGSYVLRRLWLTVEEERGYYYGFANEALWPLCHRAHVQPVFRRDDWTQYRRVNQRFADAVAEEVESDDPIILVQDYHFALVPRMLRERLPRATIVAFWHIPWPNAERFAICPHQEEILDGLLGSNIVGFQTQSHCRNFVETVDRTLEARIDHEENAIVHRGHMTIVRPYPISIEWPSRWVASSPSSACRESLRHELGLAPGTRIVVSVDRLDYTKGFEERLLMFERALELWPRTSEPLVFIQVAAPSRVQIDRYREFGNRVRALVDRINDRFGHDQFKPVVLLDRHYRQSEIVRYYRAADVCYVSSLHDGMNLVAKEFAAARDDEQGVLLLSCFAGASRQLTDALIVNPYDIDGVADVLLVALIMPPAEQRERMRAMRACVSAHNVFGWAGSMLIDACRLRQRDRSRNSLRPDPPERRL
jgi:trehalose 6-phosphate synthase